MLGTSDAIAYAVQAGRITVGTLADHFGIAIDEARGVVRALVEAGELFGDGAVTDTLDLFPFQDEDGDGQNTCSNPGGHEWAYTGSAYGGDDERWCGEGRSYCLYCGADGDA